MNERKMIYLDGAIKLVKDVCSAILSECASHYDLETVDGVYDSTLEADAILKCSKEIRKALKNMSFVEPETGRWITTWPNDSDSNFYRCSECRKLSKDRDNFCPHCGARMRNAEGR